ncbi:MAG: hypothetical protein IJA11_06590 [Oscillospiraceae bacterium]|nr:hypothetical protein [Oscillospiraceae bacterium]
MTDYLDLLLDEQQEENENEPFAWRRMRTGYRGATDEGGSRQPDSKKIGAERSDVQERDARSRSEETTARKRTADPETRLAALERAVARGRVQQETRKRSWEYAQVAQAAGGQDMRRSAAAVPGVRRELAGMLDAVFERDARRYDGPLGLF